MLGDEAVGGEIIAQHHDQVAAQRIAGIDHLAHALDAHIGPAGMQVGDAVMVRRRPAGQPGGRELVVGDDEIVRGLGGGIGRGAGHHHAEAGERPGPP